MLLSKINMLVKALIVSVLIHNIFYSVAFTQDSGTGFDDATDTGIEIGSDAGIKHFTEKMIAPIPGNENLNRRREAFVENTLKRARDAFNNNKGSTIKDIEDQFYDLNKLTKSVGEHIKNSLSDGAKALLSSHEDHDYLQCMYCGKTFKLSGGASSKLGTIVKADRHEYQCMLAEKERLEKLEAMEESKGHIIVYSRVFEIDSKIKYQEDLLRREQGYIDEARANEHIERETKKQIRKMAWVNSNRAVEKRVEWAESVAEAEQIANSQLTEEDVWITAADKAKMMAIDEWITAVDKAKMMAISRLKEKQEKEKRKRKEREEREERNERRRLRDRLVNRLLSESKGQLTDIVVDTYWPKITVWDHGAEDGDRIEILVNGEISESNIEIFHEPQTFLLELSHGKNILTIKALNEGSLSPNTASIKISSVIRGRGKQQWELNQGTNNSFQIKVEI